MTDDASKNLDIDGEFEEVDTDAVTDDEDAPKKSGSKKAIIFLVILGALAGVGYANKDKLSDVTQVVGDKAKVITRSFGHSKVMPQEKAQDIVESKSVEAVTKVTDKKRDASTGEPAVSTKVNPDKSQDKTKIITGEDARIARLEALGKPTTAQSVEGIDGSSYAISDAERKANAMGHHGHHGGHDMAAQQETAEHAEHTESGTEMDDKAQQTIAEHKQQIDALRNELQSIKEQQRQSKQDKKAFKQFIAVKQRLADGKPFDTALQTLIATPALSEPLKSKLKSFGNYSKNGIASSERLDVLFADAIHAYYNRHMSAENESEQTILTDISNWARSLVTIRKVGTDHKGTSDADRIARAEDAFKSGDIMAALNEIRALGDEAAPYFNEWSNDAYIVIQSRDMLDALETDLLANL